MAGSAEMNGPSAPTLERHYQWDRSSRLVGVSDKGQGQTQYHYDARDQVRQVQRQAVQFLGSASVLEQESYGYDAVHNVVQSQMGAHSGITGHGYSQDTVVQIGGNRYEYDARGRTISKIEQRDGFRPRQWRYEWDELDRLRTVRTPEGSVWQYRYDAFGRRVEKRCLNPQSLKNHGQGAGHGRHRRTKDRVLGASHRTRSLWQGSQIVEQWRSFLVTCPL